MEGNEIKTIFDVREYGGLNKKALLDTINAIKTNGGGMLTWIGEIVIDESIIINLRDAPGLSIKGYGERTILKVSDNVILNDGALIIDYGDDDLSTFDDQQYGVRSFSIENLYIDCTYVKETNQCHAKHGLVLGVHHPVVQSNFKMVNIVNSYDYGLVLDSTQNSHFDVVNVENCGGGILLLNGAGNNVFTKCEFDANRDTNLHLISFEERHFKNGIDGEDYFSWTDTSKESTRTRNGFYNTAQMNIFINCVIERFTGDTEIYFGRANNNSFIDCEIQANKYNRIIYISENSSHNKLSFRMGISQPKNDRNINTPIINDGCDTLIYNSYVENAGSEYIIDTCKVMKVQNLELSNPDDVKIMTERMDEGYAHNVDRNIKYFWKWDSIDKLECGQMAFRDVNCPNNADGDIILKVKDGKYYKLMAIPYEDPFTRKDIEEDKEAEKRLEKEVIERLNRENKLKAIEEIAKTNPSIKQILDDIEVINNGTN